MSKAQRDGSVGTDGCPVCFKSPQRKESTNFWDFHTQTQTPSQAINNNK